MDNDHAHVAKAGLGVARFVGGVFGFVFAGIGLTVLVFLWSASGFGEPPLFFRIFGSFIAIAFVAFGGAMLYGVITGRAMATAARPPSVPTGKPGPTAAPTTGYQCPNCGAPLAQGADVSPMGDVKCPFCQTWFNVHGRRSG